MLIKVCYGVTCQSIFSASRDKSVNMWSRGTQHPVQQFQGHDLVVTALDINKGILLVHLYLNLCSQNDTKIQV